MLQRVVDWLGKRGSIVWNRIQGREESVPGITGDIARVRGKYRGFAGHGNGNGSARALRME
jgi:hypothetical protein